MVANKRVTIPGISTFFLVSDPGLRDILLNKSNYWPLLFLIAYTHTVLPLYTLKKYYTFFDGCTFNLFLILVFYQDTFLHVLRFKC